MTKEQHLTTSADVIANIATIYDELDILPSIREHQSRVAGVILIIKEHWRTDGPVVNWDDTVAAALVHDLGNIVKAQFDTPVGQEILGPLECERIEYWRSVKESTIDSYGDDEHEVTVALCEQTSVPKRVIAIVTQSLFAHNEALVANDDWEKKLVGYADRVVGPFGILTLDERLREAAQRYGFPIYTPSTRPPAVQAAYKLQEQIQECVPIPLESITEDAVQVFARRFLRRDTATGAFEERG